MLIGLRRADSLLIRVHRRPSAVQRFASVIRRSCGANPGSPGGLFGGAAGDLFLDEQFQEQEEPGHVQSLTPRCPAGEVAGGGLFTNRVTHFHAVAY